MERAMERTYKRDLEHSEFRLVTVKDGVDLTSVLEELDRDDNQRLGRQLGNIKKKLPTINAIAQGTGNTIDSGALRRAFRKYRRTDQENMNVCLFDIVVSLEWSPSPAYLMSLKEAFARASRLLFDVTDGYMAIGAVTVGGPELMDCADIQILASNRLSPRSSVDGMHNAEKYQPVRLGRALWQKNSKKRPNDRTTIPWTARKGYATLVHEWGHYALGLKDQYLDFDPNTALVTPDRSLVEDTIMARLDSSELLDDNDLANQPGVDAEQALFEQVNRRDVVLLSPRKTVDDKDKASEWAKLRNHDRFKWLGIDPHHRKNKTPPPEKPIPAFHIIGTANDPYPPQELQFSLQAEAAGGKIIDQDCWVYVIKGPIAEPQELIAQGSYETSGGFKLLGAQTGDYVVLIGKTQADIPQPLVLWAQIADDANGTAQMGPWQDATPDPFPRIDVAASGLEGKGAAPPYNIKLMGFVPEHWKTITFPLGEAERRVGTAIDGLTVLDGHIMLISTRTEKPQFAIASYSLGGSPFSGYPAHPNPIPAGSSDGNAMLFFYDANDPSLDDKSNGQPSGPTFDASKVVVTTNLQDSTPAPPNCEPRSYTFSVTSNTSFQDLVQLHPTLILFYDMQTRRNPTDKLVIARYDADAQPPSWQLFDTTEDRPGDHLTAVSLTEDTTAPGLFADPPQAEHFRLFLKTETDSMQS